MNLIDNWDGGDIMKPANGTTLKSREDAASTSRIALGEHTEWGFFLLIRGYLALLWLSKVPSVCGTAGVLAKAGLGALVFVFRLGVVMAALERMGRDSHG